MYNSLLNTSLVSSNFMDELFSDWDNILSSSRLSYKEAFPPYNIFVEEDGAVIELGTAGFRKEDLKIRTEGDRIIITGTPRKEEEGKKEVKRRMKRTDFKCAYSVPECYDLRKISAHYEDGLLTIHVPIKEKEEEKDKEIEIL